MRKTIKNQRKGLTNDEEYGILSKLSGERKVQTKRLKKLKKSFAKPLDKPAAK